MNDKQVTQKVIIFFFVRDKKQTRDYQSYLNYFSSIAFISQT